MARIKKSNERIPCFQYNVVDLALNSSKKILLQQMQNSFCENFLKKDKKTNFN